MIFLKKTHIKCVYKALYNADLDQVQDAELTLRRVHAEHKVERGVVSVDQLVVGAANETVRGQKLDFRFKESV